MSDAPSLPIECIRALSIALMAATKMLRVGEVLFDDDSDLPRAATLALVGTWLAIVERPGDRAKGAPRRFTAYRLEEATERTAPFELRPDAALFVLHERGFYTPPDWQLTCLREPREWYNDVIQEIYEALDPHLPAA